MSLLAAMEWVDRTAFGTALRESTWAVPAWGTLHLFALSAMFGGLLVLSLRLAGLAFNGQTHSRVARAISPLLWGGAASVAISGLVLLASGAARNYYNPAFRWKMALLIPALALSVWLDRAARSGNPARWYGLVALAAVILWSLVATAGRAIGFV